MTHAAVEVVWRADERAGVLGQNHQVVGERVADVAGVEQTHAAQRDPAKRGTCAAINNHNSVQLRHQTSE